MAPEVLAQSFLNLLKRHIINVLGLRVEKEDTKLAFFCSRGAGIIHICIDNNGRHEPGTIVITFVDKLGQVKQEFYNIGLPDAEERILAHLNTLKGK